MMKVVYSINECYLTHPNNPNRLDLRLAVNLKIRTVASNQFSK